MKSLDEHKEEIIKMLELDEEIPVFYMVEAEIFF